MFIFKEDPHHRHTHKQTQESKNDMPKKQPTLFLLQYAIYHLISNAVYMLSLKIDRIYYKVKL